MYNYDCHIFSGTMKPVSAPQIKSNTCMAILRKETERAPNPQNLSFLNQSTCYSKHLGEKDFEFG